eukprot:1159306-Pelagomonas_calceolata.AAC.5
MGILCMMLARCLRPAVPQVRRSDAGVAEGRLWCPRTRQAQRVVAALRAARLNGGTVQGPGGCG